MYWLKQLMGPLVLFALLVTGPRELAAQHTATEGGRSSFPQRTDTLSVQGQGPFLVRPFIVRNSVGIWKNISETGQILAIPDSDVELNLRDGLISFLRVDPDSAFTFVIRYEYIPLRLQDTYDRWPPTIQGTTVVNDRSVQSPSSSGLTTRGSISRGVLTGSNRDAQIESGLQLQVDGEVAPGIRLEALLTDEDTPLIPEGVTRRLDQFDRIRIGIHADPGSVMLGDVDARLQRTRFGRLDRQLKGAGVEIHPFRVPNGTVAIRAGATVSRGIFRSTVLSVQDGVQGPYRLTGENGERFILILPETERVYLDGELLQRGVAGDYTIDYSTAEITFTANRMMGSDRRVWAEFQYTTNRFTRTLVYGEAEGSIQIGQRDNWMNWAVSSIREADGSAFVDELGLSAADSTIVASSTDGDVRVSGATRVSYDPKAIYTQYFLLDGATGAVRFAAVDRAPLEGEAVYRVVFSFVGAGLGSYRRVAGLSGNVAYEWVGDGMGAYLPERTLPVPIRKTLSAVSLGSEAIPGLDLQFEWSLFEMDRNRLSTSSSSRITGQAGQIGARTQRLSVLDGWSVEADALLARRQAAFQTFERIRDVEFLRSWNLPLEEASPLSALMDGQDERQSRIGLTVSGRDSTRLVAGLETLTIGDVINADRQLVAFQSVPFDLVQVRLDLSATQSRDTAQDSGLTKQILVDSRVEWLRPSGMWRPWLEWERERYEGSPAQQMVAGDLIRRMPADEVRLGSSMSAPSWSLSGWVEQRQERDGQDIAHGPYRYRTVQARYEWHGSNRLESSVTGGVRHRKRADGGDVLSTTDLAGDRSVVLSWSGQAGPTRNQRVQWQYDVRSEQTAALQEVYLRTGPERGSFVWIDENSDGVIQEDEFLPEIVPGEGEYARVLFPSDSLESVTTASLRISHDHSPKSDAPGWRRISIRSVLDLTESSRLSNRTDIALFRPDALRRSGSTISGRYRLSQQFSLFPFAAQRDVDVNWLATASLAELASGAQESSIREAGLRWREDIRGPWSGTLHLKQVRDESNSSRFASRTYRIERTEVQPGIQWNQAGIRLQSSLLIMQAADAGSGVEVHTWRTPAEGLFRIRSTSWRLSAEWSRSDVSGGSIGGLQGFEMTDGRGPGTSWMWSARMDARLSDVLTATMQYDGRLPDGMDAIHTGRFQLTARF